MKNDLTSNHQVEEIEKKAKLRAKRRLKKMDLHGKSVFKLREIIQQKSGGQIDLKKGEG
jgi:hypothetical protein